MNVIERRYYFVALTVFKFIRGMGPRPLPIFLIELLPATKLL